MRLLWIHKFILNSSGSGNFMRNAYSGFEKYAFPVDLKYLGSLNSIFSVFSKLLLLKKDAKKYQLIHAQQGGLVAYLASKTRVPKVVTLIGSDFYGRTYLNGGFSIKDFLIKKLLSRMLPKFNHIIVVSNRMKNDLESKKYAPNVPVSILPCPIDFNLFMPSDKLLAREKLRLDPDKHYVLFASLSSDNPVKRASLAISSVDLAKSKNPNIEILNVSGVDLEMMPVFCNAADLVLLTSSHEGWPNIIKECLACNTPFVASDVSDLAELAKKSDYCHVVESDNPLSYCEKILEILELIHSRGEPATRNFVEHMSIENYSQKLVSIYNEILNGRLL